MKTLLCVTLCLIVGLIPLLGDDAPPQLDAKTLEILGAASGYYAGLKSFQVEEHVVMKSSFSEMQAKMEVGSDFTIAISRPALFASVKHGGTPEEALVSNGKTVTAYLGTIAPAPGRKEYIVEPAPDNIADLLTLSTKTKYGRVLPHLSIIESFLAEYPFGPLVVAGHTSGNYVGSETVGEAHTEHVCLTTKFGPSVTTTDLWFATDAKPLLIQARISSLTSGRQYGYDFSFSNWRVNEPIPPAQFEFTPTADAIRVSDFSMPERKAEVPPWIQKAPSPSGNGAP